MTDRERSLVTWLIKIMDEATKEMAVRTGEEAEPFMRLSMIAYEALDRPNESQLAAYREWKFQR